MEASYNECSYKLSKSDEMISKIRHSVDTKTLKLVCHAIFESHLSDVSLIWAQIYHQLKEFLFYKNIAQDNLFSIQKCSHESSFQKLKKFNFFQQSEHFRIIYPLANLSTKYFQQFFLTASHYHLNMIHITPDGQTKVLSLFLSIVPKPIVHICKY